MPPMPRKKPDTPSDGRKARRSDPPMMQWRDGRPAWIPGPALRREGWTLIALKDEAGAYLPRGLARVMARNINDDVTKWRADPAAPGRRFGPLRGAAVVASPGRDTPTLNNAFERFRDHRTIRRLSPHSREGYRRKLAPFLAWAGGEHPATINRAMLTALYESEWDRIFAMRALGWTEEAWTAAPRVADADGARHVPSVRAARWEALDEAREGGSNVAGLAQVNAMIRAVSRLYSFIADELGWVEEGYNPAARFGLAGLKPRLVLPTDAQLVHLVETADAMGLSSIGDALVILANAGPRPADMVRWQMQLWREGRIDSLVRKTSAKTSFKFPAVLRKRLSEVQLRRETARAEETLRAGAPDLILITDGRQIAYTVDRLDKVFDQVRAEAAKSMPDVAGLAPYDFRKKAITRLQAAGNSRDDIAAITGHSYRTIATILDHYIVPTADAADAAVDRLDAMMKEQGVKW